MKVVVALDRRDEAEKWCEYLNTPGAWIWGTCVWDDSPAGMSFIYEFPDEYEDIGLVFSLKFA